MPRRIQPTYTKAKRHTLAAIGDSLTLQYQYSMHAGQYWPYLVAHALQALGYPIKERNFGIAGQTSWDTVQSPRIDCVSRFDTPDIVAIAIGVNDNAQIPQTPGMPNLGLANANLGNTLAAGSVDPGAHDYYFSFLVTNNSVTGETQANGPYTVTVPAGGSAQQVTLTGLPALPTGATATKLYRTKAGLPLSAGGAMSPVGTTTGTSFVDNTADSTLAAAPTALTAATGSAGSVTSGAHDYAVTFVLPMNSVSVETLPSVHTTYTADGSHQVNLTAIPLGPAGTTARKVYRTQAGKTGPLFLLTTISDNTTTTYTDTATDATLIATPVNPPSMGTTQSNIETMIRHYVANGLTRFLVAGVPYENYATGGDWNSGGGSLNAKVFGTPNTGYNGVRAGQNAATARTDLWANTNSVVYCDVYTAMGNVILNSSNIPAIGGVDSQWNIATSNVHLNAAGEQQIANAVSASVQAQAAWLTAIST